MKLLYGVDNGMQTYRSEESERSIFVTVLSWILICLAGFGVFAGLMYAAMVAFIFPEMFQSFEGPQGESISVPDDGWTALRVMVGLFLLIELLFLYSSISLLQRRNWARRVIIIVLGLGLLCSVVIVIGGAFAVFVGIDVPGDAEGFPEDFDAFFRVAFGFAAIFAGAMGVLLAWLIKRLRSAAVRKEFGVVRAA